MRITRETLIRVAKETAIKQAMNDRSLVAVYLTGSVLTPDPFLGASTDIDLVAVHSEAPTVAREIAFVTPEVNLDIRHAHEAEYRNPKELRIHPRLGPELYNPLWLYETRHFLEFVQAAVRTKYHDPENVFARARATLGASRQMWLELRAAAPAGAARVQSFLESAAQAANAVALLNGTPLTERRFLLQFPERAAAAGMPDLAGEFATLTGSLTLPPRALEESLPDWKRDLENAADRPNADAEIASPRWGYYKGGITFILSGERPQAAFWPLLRSWTRAALCLPLGMQARWKEFCENTGLGEAGFEERLLALDHFLDRVEELLEGKAASTGL